MPRTKKTGESHKKARTKKAPAKRREVARAGGAVAVEPSPKGYCPKWDAAHQEKIVGARLALERAEESVESKSEALKEAKAHASECMIRFRALTRPIPEIDKRGQRNMYPDAKGVDESAAGAVAPGEGSDAGDEAEGKADSGGGAPITTQSTLASLKLSAAATDVLYNCGCRTVSDLVDVMVSHHKRGEDWREYFKKLDAKSADKIARLLHDAGLLPKRFPKPGETPSLKLVGGTAAK